MPEPRLRALPPLPDYPRHEGRRMVWEDWRPSARITCLAPTPCQKCSSTAVPWFCAARGEPLPGETFTSAEPRRRGHTPGAAYKQVQVPAWPVYWLCAFSCADCAHLEVLDMQNDFAPVDINQPTLF